MGGKRLLPKFIGSLRVLRRLGNAYTIELPCRLRPYYQYGLLPVRKALALKHLQQILVVAMLTFISRLKLRYFPAKLKDILTIFYQLVAKRTLFSLVSKLREGKVRSVILPTPSGSGSQCQPKSYACSSRVRGPSSTHTLCDQVESKHQLKAASQSEGVSPPPTHSLVAHGGQCFLVERMLNHRDVKGRRTSYLVR